MSIDIARHLAPELAADDCPSCDGEGYFYEEVVGRFAIHPLQESRCPRCNGLGVIVPDADQLDLW